MFKLIALIVCVAAIVPYNSASVVPKHHAKSCYQVKEFIGAVENGLYTLYDSNDSPYATYCDFESDAPFIWTLLESFSLQEAQKTVNRKGLLVDHAVSECHLSWASFRLSKARMDTIVSVYGSTHYRATCNFNYENGTGLENRRDYLRGQLCANTYTFSSYNGYLCRTVDYMNVRGQMCRSCNAAFRVSSSIHNHIDLTKTATTCSVTAFADAIADEDVFGQYANANPLFSCAATQNSTTNWWVGGTWVTETV